MAGVRAGYGLTLGSTTTEIVESLSANLSDHALPRWDDENLQFLDSGLVRDPDTGTLITDADIMTTGRIQSGVATFGLGLAQDITAAAENVAFTNRVTNTVFHPTWQTAGIDGNWNSVQRTPVGNLVTNHPFQAIDTEEITNPDFMFTSLPVNNRLYAVNIEPVNTVSNVRVLIQQNNGTEFVDYWRSQPFDLVADTQQNVVIRPFIDLFASTQYRFITITDEDVILKGDTNGIPRILITYWQWEDINLATQPYVGDYRLDGVIGVSADVSITTSNAAQYQNKLWLVTGSEQIDITIADDLELTFFAVHVVSSSGSVLLENAGGDSSSLIDGESNQTYTGRTSVIFSRSSNNVYFPLSSHGLDAGGSVTGASFAANVLTLTRSEILGDLTATIPAATTSAAGAMSSEDKTKLDGIEDGAEVNEQANWTETDTNEDSYIQNKPTIPSLNWDHATITSGQLPPNNRRWYTYTGTGNSTIQMPLESGIESGWHSFIGNDSTTGTVTMTGDFRGSLTSIALLPQQGCEMSYNGSIFLEGANRDLITVSSFPDWAGNPLQHDTTYTGFSTNSTGINVDATGGMEALTALLNKNIRVSTRTDNDFVFDLPILNSGNFTAVPMGNGFGLLSDGPQETLIRPRSTNTLTRATLTHNFADGVRLFPGASVTFVRSGATTWNVTIQSGTITGGS